MMINRLKIISLYFAVIVLISISYLFSSLPGKFEMYLTIFIWLTYCGIPLIILSYITGAHKLRYWSEAETTGPSIVIIFGHLGPLYAVYYFILMTKVGYGSGIVFIPSILWVFIFYIIGVMWCLARIASVKFSEERMQN